MLKELHYSKSRLQLENIWPFFPSSVFKTKPFVHVTYFTVKIESLRFSDTTDVLTYVFPCPRWGRSLRFGFVRKFGLTCKECTLQNWSSVFVGYASQKKRKKKNEKKKQLLPRIESNINYLLSDFYRRYRRISHLLFTHSTCALTMDAHRFSVCSLFRTAPSMDFLPTKERGKRRIPNRTIVCVNLSALIISARYRW